jgi:hypothetical protein
MTGLIACNLDLLLFHVGEKGWSPSGDDKEATFKAKGRPSRCSHQRVYTKYLYLAELLGGNPNIYLVLVTPAMASKQARNQQGSKT